MADGSASREDIATRPEPRAVAQHAIERVCSNADPAAAIGVYSADFLDHVNARDYDGHEGIRRSLALYQLVFADGDLQIRVVDQVGEGDRVVSRWVAEGHNRGKRLGLWGITISHVVDGEIVEDWSASDNLDVLRQLGVRRGLRLGLDWLRTRRKGGSTRGQVGQHPEP
jgi:predicted ester cyclase